MHTKSPLVFLNTVSPRTNDSIIISSFLPRPSSTPEILLASPVESLTSSCLPLLRTHSALSSSDDLNYCNILVTVTKGATNDKLSIWAHDDQPAFQPVSTIFPLPGACTSSSPASLLYVLIIISFPSRWPPSGMPSLPLLHDCYYGSELYVPMFIPPEAPP